MVVGTPGGPRIITMVYHVISNVIDHRMPLPDAVAAPRMHHQALPDSLRVEEGGFTRRRSTACARGGTPSTPGGTGATWRRSSGRRAGGRG